MIATRFKAYSELIRWDRPIGYFLLLWPTLIALLLAGQGRPHALLIFVFICGTVVTRAAGCIINDLTDRKFDPFVERTQKRPLARNAVSIFEAITLVIILLFIALILALQLNTYAFILSCIAAILMLIYPWMKRFTYFPQIILGIAWNISILMAFAAQNNHIPFSAWLLYFCAVIWSVVYDTMYAMVDREDDIRIGIKSTAIFFGSNDRAILAGLQLLIIVLLLMVGLFFHLNFWYHYSILFVLACFFYQHYLIRNRIPENCFNAFLNHNWAWLGLFLGVYLSLSP